MFDDIQKYYTQTDAQSHKIFKNIDKNVIDHNNYQDHLHHHIIMDGRKNFLKIYPYRIQRKILEEELLSQNCQMLAFFQLAV